MTADGKASQAQTHADAATAFRGAAAGPSAARQAVELLAVTAGIYACYLNYGLLQERIYAADYDGERFTDSAFLVLVQTAANAAVAAAVLALQKFAARGKKKSFAEAARAGKATPYFEYAGVALCYLSAMLFSFTALNHMSYPMQALGKSCKMVPVMVMGVVIRRRRYSAREYICVLLVTMGVAAFSIKPSKAGAAPTSPVGAALLAASLFMDGVTGPLQERLVARHAPSTHQLMMWQNVASVVWLTVGLTATGRMFPSARFVVRHAGQGLMRDILAFASVSAVGQNFIFYTVRNFSALATTTITTTRKMFTVLLSIVVYKHKMVPRQWAGMALVFIAIAWEAAAKVNAKRQRIEAGNAKKAEGPGPNDPTPASASASEDKKDL